MPSTCCSVFPNPQELFIISSHRVTAGPWQLSELSDSRKALETQKSFRRPGVWIANETKAIHFSDFCRDRTEPFGIDSEFFSLFQRPDLHVSWHWRSTEASLLGLGLRLVLGLLLWHGSGPGGHRGAEVTCAWKIQWPMY